VVLGVDNEWPPPPDGAIITLRSALPIRRNAAANSSSPGPGHCHCAPQF
jgi:hypothetical protein